MTSHGSTWTSLLLDVHARTEPTKSARLQAALRDAIRCGRLTTGDRLPATRGLADELGVARNVVVDAYDQLAAEGFVVARTGSGTVVAARPVDPTIDGSVDRGSAADGRSTEDGRSGNRVPVDIDLSPGLPDLAAFPMREWRRCLAEVIDTMPAAELGYTDGRGAVALRQELCRYTHRVRGAVLDPESIVITTGVSAALGLLARTVVPLGRTRFAVEDPGAYTQWASLRATGATIVPVPVDHEGMCVEQLDATDADVVVVSPAHQYPLGAVLAPHRREWLLSWARARPGRVVVEDDYDAEFRFDRKPVGTLQGLAPDVVALTNSVSKTIAPGLRIGWLACPPTIASDVAARIAAEFTTPDTIGQHALARLLRSGRFDRIIRARRRAYQARRAALADALGSVDGCSVVGHAGGLHLTVMLPDAADDFAASEHMTDSGVRVPPLSAYRIEPGPPGLVMSFSNLDRAHPERIAAALRHALDAADVI